MRSSVEPQSPVESATSYLRESGTPQTGEGCHDHHGGMNRSERIGFWMYVAMGTFCAAVLGAAAISAILA
jgi:hypothetical protein